MPHTLNPIEDRVIGMIDAHWARIENKIQWLHRQGHTPERISIMLNINPVNVKRIIERSKDNELLSD
jgi:hypothetical protein